MTCRVRVHLEVVPRRDTFRLAEHHRTEACDVLVSSGEVVDPQVEMHLLWRAVRPVGSPEVGHPLQADPWCTIDEDGAPPHLGVELAAR